MFASLTQYMCGACLSLVSINSALLLTLRFVQSSIFNLVHKEMEHLKYQMAMAALPSLVSLTLTVPTHGTNRLQRVEWRPLKSENIIFVGPGDGQHLGIPGMGRGERSEVSNVIKQPPPFPR